MIMEFKKGLIVRCDARGRIAQSLMGEARRRGIRSKICAGAAHFAW